MPVRMRSSVTKIMEWLKAYEKKVRFGPTHQLPAAPQTRSLSLQRTAKLIDLKEARVKSPDSRLRIAVVANTDWYVHNFRTTLIQSLISDGHEVYVFTPSGPYFGQLAAAGAKPIDIPMSRTGKNVLEELKTIYAIRLALKKYGIDAVLSYTPKGNIYSALAAKWLNTRIIANISGLGRAFSSSTRLTLLVKIFYKISLSTVDTIFFQNQDDFSLFVEENIVPTSKSRRVPGSGVNLSQFSATSPAPRNPFTVIMIARLIKEKGVYEYVYAANKILQTNPNTRFILLGPIEDSHSAISEQEILSWQKAGIIEYAGATDGVKKYLEQSHCATLPSYYREGVPRTLLEAASMGLPVVTTDNIGCRDAVNDTETGYICEPRNPEDLADKLLMIIQMPEEKRLQMGYAGRKKMEMEFDEKSVIEKYHTEINSLELPWITTNQQPSNR